MNIFSSMKKDEEQLQVSMEQSFTTLGCIQLMAISPNQSGVTTTPLDGVSVIIVEV
jgi:hypothetical protein